MKQAFVSLLALLHLANVAQCCCGHYCIRPNEVCGAAESPMKAGGSCWPGPESEGPSAPQEKKPCVHFGPGPHLENVDYSVDPIPAAYFAVAADRFCIRFDSPDAQRWSWHPPDPRLHILLC